MSVERVLSPTDGSVIGYKVRWRDSAGTSRRKTVRLWRDAVALDAEIKRKKVMGELITHEKGKITLDDFWEVWWKNYAVPNLTVRTRANYQRLWSKHVAPTLGSTTIRTLNTEQIASLSSRLSGTLSSSSVRKCLAVMQSVLQRAVEWGYIATNPASGVRKPRLVQRSGVALDAAAISAICQELGLRSATIVRVLAGSGMRPGELRALTWADVHHDKIVVTTAVSNDVVGPTKTNRLRSVAPTEDAKRALSEWSLAQGRPGPRDLVFPAVRGSTGMVARGAGSTEGVLLWTDNAYRLWAKNVFSPAANRAGLKGLRPYDLRHTFASQQIAAGADILTLAHQLGHSPTMTLTVYGHLLGSRHEPTTLPEQLLAQLHGA